jgi:ATP-dependent Clp protease ATP-binding subunit ClpA
LDLVCVCLSPLNTPVGCVQCIGATTLDEYRKHIEKDPALERRFQPVLVPEPTVEETIDILKGLRERYEIHHKLRYTDEALVAAAQLSYQYIRFVWMCVACDVILFEVTMNQCHRLD